MVISIRDSFTFNDLMLIPKYSEIESRSSVDLSVKLSKDFHFAHPIVPANMASISGIDMAMANYRHRGLSLLHRFAPFEEQLELASTISKNEHAFNHIGFSVGVKNIDYERVEMLVKNGVRILCIDIAHAHSSQCIRMTKFIAEKHKHVLLIAGNVATAEGARALWKAGADIVKVNIGAGSTCSTRIETGNGVPQLTALSDVYDMKLSYERECGRELFIMADGGIVNTADFVKSLCFSNMVMSGYAFAGTDETPGEKILIDNIEYKSYVGSSTHKTNHVEGVKSIVEAKGQMSKVLQKAFEGIRSGCSYQGSKNLNELRIDPQFVRLTNAGWAESGSHDVKIVQ